MKIQKIWTVYHSATGNTRAVVRKAAAAAAEKLGVDLEELRFSTPEDRARELTFGSGDLVFVAVPVYAGKMPNKLLPDYQTKLHGNGAFAAAVVTFGNRSYDNGLAELCETLEQAGFHTVSGGAFVGQHAFAEALAPGRPNEADLEEAADFGRKTAEKLGALTELPAPVQVKGDPSAPYYVPRGVSGEPAKFLKAKPKTHEDLCTQCGLCAQICPMGAIDLENACEVPGICIKCQACVRQCPTEAKYFDDPAFLDHLQMLELNYTEPKHNEVFF